MLALSEVLRSADGGEMMRLMLATMLQALVDAEAAVRGGAGLHERSGARVTQRNETREKVVSTTSGSSSTRRACRSALCWFLAVYRVGWSSAGVRWKSVYSTRENTFEFWLINQQHIKVVPGRKSDVCDAAWLAQLVAHGLVRPSFVPQEPIG